MIDFYANVDYDEKTRRINRWIKFAGGAIGALLFFGLVAVIANADLDSDGKARFSNDTDGTVTCFALYRSNAFDEEEVELRESGRFDAWADGRLPFGSSCSVFDRDGNYVSCLRVRNRGDGREVFQASSGDRRVKADACVYPR